ncbi:GNAT family N-acetyltransferase [Nocardia inohanensis]|uniref:GNAT family N-acetyltransferase n=1 Tax=Nocardia inohanensis TaxID=209246 RepID=UPI0008375C9E|nr:GNAT family N-acetyltransferase [Nocardia inohanensis]
MPEAAAGPDALIVTPATREQWSVVTDWAAAEGWNPGERDTAAFFAQDPEGFLLGHLDGEPVSAVSVVNYSSDYAFLGFYLVRPDLRGRGLGMATWKAGLAHAGDRVIGLDGVPGQQRNYRRSGFEFAYGSARFTGVPQPAPSDGSVRALEPADLPAVHAYDSACLPADREPFLTTWLADPGNRTLVRFAGGELTGYAAVRPARDCLRVGPLFADDARSARELLAALAELAGGAAIALDVPLCNDSAVRLAEESGLTPSFETARMYTGPVRDHHRERVFGATTLELG